MQTLPSGPCKQVGGLVGRVLAGLAAVDGEDPIARPHAGLLGGAAADHADDHQRAALGLQLDAQSDEVAVDLGIDFAELVGREIGRIGVERIGGAAEVFQDHDRGRQTQALLGQVGGHHGTVAGFHATGHAALGQRLAELAAEGLHRGRIAAGQVPLEEDRLAQGRLQVRGAPLDQVLPRRLLHVMGLDLQQHLQIEFQGLLGRHPRDLLGKAAVGVAAAQVVVQPGQLETLLQDVLLGELPQALFIMGQGLAPTPLDFQFLAALQVAVDLDRSLGKSKGRSGRLLCHRGHGQQGHCRKAEKGCR